MRTTVRALLVAVGLLLSGAVAVAAADFCIDTNSGGNTLVLKAFSLPGKGVCKDTRGFYIVGPYWVKGTACGSSDGVDITFYSSGFDNSGTFYFTDFFKLLRASPTTTVAGKDCAVYTASCFSYTYAKTTCSPSTVPLP